MNGHWDALSNAKFLNASDVRQLVRDLSTEEKVALIAEELSDLPAEQKAEILDRQGLPEDLDRQLQSLSVESLGQVLEIIGSVLQNRRH